MPEPRGEDATIIAITYGYSRDHREDLKQRMLARASTHDGDIPLFMQPLDGTSLDKVSRLSAITAIQRQLGEADGETSVYVADNGVYSETNITQQITWEQKCWHLGNRRFACEADARAEAL